MVESIGSTIYFLAYLSEGFLITFSINQNDG